MKPMIFAAALMLSGAAFAQTTTDTMPAGQPDASTATAPAAGMTVAPDNSNPRRDARGVPVVSDAATAPAGWNSQPSVGGTGASPSAPAAPQGSAGPLPPCTRKVTDHCTQTYERGVKPS
jgi:hypothetical protein